MKTIKIVVVMLALMLGSAPAFAQGTTDINFDDVPNATDISTHYPGVTFACDGSICGSSKKIFARATASTASLPNSVTPVEMGFPGVRDNLTGRVRIELASQASSVSIDARSIRMPEGVTDQHALVIAQDSAGRPVGQALGTQMNVFETLNISTTGKKITFVYLGVENGGTSALAQFDNLHVLRAGNWIIDGLGALPSWIWAAILAAAGLAGIFVARHFRRV